MTTLETMYAPQINSPATSLASNITSSSTSISVANGSVLPAAPMLLVIGGDTENAETVLMTAKSSNTLTVTRGVEGTARSWTSGATVARLFTAKDLSALQSNVTALNSGKAEAGDVPTASTSTPQMDGSGSYGSGTTYARGNHVHPTDTTRQAKITASGILKGDGNGGVTAAVAGTDYQAPLTASGVLFGDGNGNVTAKAVDTAPASGSSNLITSGAVYAAIIGAMGGSY